MLYTRDAQGTVDQVCERLEEAVTRNHFGVLGMHNLKEKMASKGVEFGPECRVFEVCNPVQAKKVLEANMAIANALPCRICVYEERGAVRVSTIRPTAILGLFGDAQLQEVAYEVETTLERIIDEACE
ncbi:MAG: DUF302 domain-containing protein [Candidatus Hydrogenedentes bacterium]|nr:DUF302 domain-containing protein [Candidatus Hydrogenedentota bacterium]